MAAQLFVRTEILGSPISSVTLEHRSPPCQAPKSFADHPAKFVGEETGISAREWVDELSGATDARALEHGPSSFPKRGAVCPFGTFSRKSSEGTRLSSCNVAREWFEFMNQP